MNDKLELPAGKKRERKGDILLFGRAATEEMRFPWMMWGGSIATRESDLAAVVSATLLPERSTQKL